MSYNFPSSVRADVAEYDSYQIEKKYRLTDYIKLGAALFLTFAVFFVLFTELIATK